MWDTTKPCQSTQQYDINGELIYKVELDQNGHVNYVYNKEKNGDVYENTIKSNKDGFPLHYHLTCNGVAVKDYIYKYDSQNKCIYIKKVSGKTAEELYYEYDVQGKLCKMKSSLGRSETYGHNELGNITSPLAAKKAATYMKQYHGLFIHSTGLDVYEILETLNSGDSHNDVEMCVSTVRANKPYAWRPDDTNDLLLIGFGNIRELYDADVNSAYGPGGQKFPGSGFHDDQPEDLHAVNNTMGFHKDDKQYYDEGLMNMKSMDLILAVLSDEDEQSYDTIKKLKSQFPYVKFMSPDYFDRIKSSEALMRLVYRLKQDRDIEKIRSGELGMYDEQYLPTFKQYFLK